MLNTDGIFVAGSDTFVSGLATFFLIMALHPEIQTKAQEELNSVLGKRLPEFGDKPHLPYIVSRLLYLIMIQTYGLFRKAYATRQADLQALTQL